MKLILVLSVVVSCVGCVTTSPQEESRARGNLYWKDTPAGKFNAANPLDPETKKKWDKYLSDDVVEVYIIDARTRKK